MIYTEVKVPWHHCTRGMVAQEENLTQSTVSLPSLALPHTTTYIFTKSYSLGPKFSNNNTFEGVHR